MYKMHTWHQAQRRSSKKQMQTRIPEVAKLRLFTVAVEK
jgi:hypothetical protein